MIDEWKEARVNYTLPLWYDVGHEVSLVLGNTLIKWSEQAISYPFETTFEEWVEALRTHGEALRDYGLDYLDEEEDFDKADENDARRVKKAQAALRWVAENLESMWD